MKKIPAVLLGLATLAIFGFGPALAAEPVPEQVQDSMSVNPPGKYSGMWFADKEHTKMGTGLVVTLDDNLQAIFDFSARNMVCGGKFPANGRRLRDGRVQFVVDRSVKSDGSESVCRDRPQFTFTVTGDTLESPYATLRRR